MNFNLDSIPSKEIMPGYHAKLVHAEHMSIAFWEVEEGAVVPEHSHMNEQIMHVLKGRFEFTVNGNTNIHVANDLVVIPPHAVHSGKALTACKLMDVFSPVREAYK
ncbi:cupin domain-containing protein [Pareuzebyella sediminis]|uniref:cupin domain-containing protein n=1 Tax=Pareuzebyella sediminis TaxID=2607998 RepID=UPI0011EC7279|nr:cupin domain-containing protein [Pareuzebyella sediminis]